jgi:hypothetical protein
MWFGWRSEISYIAEVFPLAAAMAIGLHRYSKSHISKSRADGIETDDTLAIT